MVENVEVTDKEHDEKMSKKYTFILISMIVLGIWAIINMMAFVTYTEVKTDAAQVKTYMDFYSHDRTNYNANNVIFYYTRYVASYEQYMILKRNMKWFIAFPEPKKLEVQFNKEEEK